ncbi:DUF6221 family protein [Amycolatopsis sp. BJA-103]|uniref:DUF6221 family protein n=1 Tax=Amycolatopsis sp. BJA-103 TaxID=1911175 RepID=UPI003513018C
MVDGDSIRIYDEGGHDVDQALHIADNDPRFVLADVAAKRRILDDAVPRINAMDDKTEDGWATVTRARTMKHGFCCACSPYRTPTTPTVAPSGGLEARSRPPCSSPAPPGGRQARR